MPVPCFAGLFIVALFHGVKNGCKNICQPENSRNCFISGDKQGLMMSHYKLMNGLINGGVFCHVFPLTEYLNEIRYRDIVCFRTNIS